MKGRPILVGASVAAALTAFFLALPTPSSPASGMTPVAGQEAARSKVLAIRGARIFDGTAVLERATVVVADGKIAAVGADVAVPEGAESLDATGKTLLPGLVDAHTHPWGTALEDALRFGVTAELSMFSMPDGLEESRKERASAKKKSEADLFSSGILATAPGGHGTEYGMKIPTLTKPEEAKAFVDARIAEGSDYLKIVLEDGAPFGVRFASIDDATLAALVEAAHARGLLAVVHVSTFASARRALAAKADGLAHSFGDVEADAAFVALAKERGAFVITTLTVLEGFTGKGAGEALIADQRLAPFLTDTQKGSLKASFPKRESTRVNAGVAAANLRRLHAAGVPLLAGTDAPNPGTAHGVSLHRELELLVSAGLTPLEALAAATSVPAKVFKLDGRGRIAAGARADLVLVDGDPTADITATRAIAAIWKDGHRVDRKHAEAQAAAVTKITAPVVLGAFDERPAAGSKGAAASASAPLPAGWHAGDDRRMGGASDAVAEVVAGGANGTPGALRITGELRPGFAFPWAGAFYFPGPVPMQPADLSNAKELIFWARGDGRTYDVKLFADSAGPVPASRTFPVGTEWSEVKIPLASFRGVDLKAVKGLGWNALETGTFRLEIDQVELR